MLQNEIQQNGNSLENKYIFNKLICLISLEIKEVIVIKFNYRLEKNEQVGVQIIFNFFYVGFKMGKVNK